MRPWPTSWERGETLHANSWRPFVRPRVLLVEDEAVVGLEVSHRLERLGYEVAGVAPSGNAALEMAGDIAPDIVLMDIFLGGREDGIETASRIRERHGTPIIFLTAHADPATLRRAAAIGPDGFIVKPFDDRELRAALEIALHKSGMERRLRENEHWMATTLKNLGEGLITADPSGLVRFVNPAGEQLLGAAARELLGREFDAVYRASPVVPPSAMPDCPEGRTLALLRCPDGRHIPVEHAVSPILDDEGRSLGKVAVFRDVSQRQRAEQALRESVTTLRRALEGTVNALTVTSEIRDPFTAGHQERVSRLAAALAEGLGMSGEEREGVRVAGLVHDIGKIHVPSEILAKPDLLSEMEWGIVRDHCSVGHDILRDIPFPWPVARMVLEHHERLDGSGYPGGLRGEEVLWGSRVLAVADVVEAMNSHRPYRGAPGMEKALKEIRAGRGIRYDAAVVDACLDIVSSGAFRF